MDIQNPTLIIIGGINGAGKSTYVHEYKSLIKSNDYEIIDPDAIGYREAIKLSKEYIEAKKCFIRETTLSGYSIHQLIKTAKQNSYNIALMYFMLDDLEEAIKRVKNRVNIGGHFIDDKTIEKRFESYKENLLKAIEHVNRGIIFDNTKKKLAKIAQIKNGEIFLINNNPIYSWLKV